MLLGVRPRNAPAPLLTTVSLWMPSTRCMLVALSTPVALLLVLPMSARPAAFKNILVPTVVKKPGFDTGFRFGIGSGAKPRAARAVTREVWMFSGLELVL